MIALNTRLSQYFCRKLDQSAVMQKPPISFLGLHALQYSKHICLRRAVWREFSGRIPCFTLTISRSSSTQWPNFPNFIHKFWRIFALKLSKNPIETHERLFTEIAVLTIPNQKMFLLAYWFIFHLFGMKKKTLKFLG